MESTPEFLCFACQQRAPIRWLRFWRDESGRSRRLCQGCFDGMALLAARAAHSGAELSAKPVAG